MKPFQTLGLEQAKKYANQGALDVWGEFTNERKAHCKVCGRELAKGEGIGAYFWAMQVGRGRLRHLPKCRLRVNPMGRGTCICGFRNQHVFVCPECDGEMSNHSICDKNARCSSSQGKGNPCPHPNEDCFGDLKKRGSR